MDIQQLLFASLGLWVLFQFWIIPSLRKSIPELVSKKDISRIALHSAADAICKLLKFIIIATAITLLCVMYINATGGVDVKQIADTVSKLEFWQAIMSGWNKGLGLFTFVALSGGLIYTSYRSGKKSIEDRWNEKFKEEFERIVVLKENNKLENLEPTKAMQEIETKLAEYDEYIRGLQDDHSESAKEIARAFGELAQYYHFLDIERRIDVSIPTENFEEQPLWMKIIRPFISQGALNTTKRGATFLSVILSLLLIPSFFAITAPILKDTATEKIVEMRGKIETLQLTASLEQAERDLQGIEQIYPPSELSSADDSEWTDEDQQLADALGSEFESNVINARVFGETTARFSNAALRSYSRQQILRARSGVDPASRVNNVGTAGSEAERAISETYTNPAHRQTPQTDLGRKFSGELKTFKHQQPKLWDELGNKYKRYIASFSEVPPPRAIKGMLLSKSIGNLTGAVELDNYIGKVGEKIVGDIPKSVGKIFYDTTSKEFLARMINEPDISQAIKSVSKIPGTTLRPERLQVVSDLASELPTEQRISEVWDNHPPSYERLSNPAISNTNAQKTIDRYAQLVGRSAMRSGGIEALASFDDYFPGYEGAHEKTAQAKTQAKYGVNPVNANSTITTNRTKVVRARSFTRLRGFARVGGVLIGRPPAEETPLLNFEKIMWNFRSDGEVDLQLSQNDKTIDLGSYDPELSALAMSYAADGRPTTVTMVTASPLLELKILVHPTIEDTSIGCLATRLDQLVDEISSEENQLKDKLQQDLNNIRSQHALYSLTWTLRAINLTKDPASASATMLTRIGLSGLIKTLSDRYLQDHDSRAVATNALGTPKDARMFMYEKSMFYQQSLVATIESCISKTSLKSYASCVSEKVEPQKQIYDEDLYWAAPPPGYQPWSGVRESAYTLDNDLKFTQWQATTEKFPLEFTYQIAFTTPAFFIASNTPWYSERNADIENYFDTDPWELIDYKQKINAAILKKYNTDPTYKRILSSMAEFTILQRIFRLGVNGYFGDNFSTENMITMAQKTSKYIKASPTRRWLSRAGGIEQNFLIQSESNLLNVPNLKNTQNRLLSCARLFTNIKDIYELASLPAETWDKYCLLDTSYAGETLAVLSKHVSLVRQLRLDLGIVAEDAKWRNNVGCIK